MWTDMTFVIKKSVNKAALLSLPELLRLPGNLQRLVASDRKTF
ncbi:hypothetical protein [Nostoc sp.]